MRKVTDIIRKKLVVFALIMASVFVGVASPMAVSMTNVEEAKATEMFSVDFRTILGSDMGWTSRDPSVLDGAEIKLYKLSTDKIIEIIGKHNYPGGKSIYTANELGIYEDLIAEGELISTWTASKNIKSLNLTGGDYFITISETLAGWGRSYIYFNVSEDGKEIKRYNKYYYSDFDTTETIYKEGSIGESRSIDVGIGSSDLLAKYVDPDVVIYDSDGNNLTNECEIDFYKKDDYGLTKNLTTGKDFGLYWDKRETGIRAALEHPGTHLIRCVKVPDGYKTFDDVTLNIITDDNGWPQVSIDEQSPANAESLYGESAYWYRGSMGKPYVVKITLEDAVTADSVQLNKSTLTLAEGKSETLTATVLPEDAYDKTVTWSSSDENVATVDANGKVTAQNIGTTEITAKTNNGKTAICKVKVNSKVSIQPFKVKLDAVFVKNYFNREIYEVTATITNTDINPAQNVTATIELEEHAFQPSPQPSETQSIRVLNGNDSHTFKWTIEVSNLNASSNIYRYYVTTSSDQTVDLKQTGDITLGGSTPVYGIFDVTRDAWSFENYGAETESFQLNQKEFDILRSASDDPQYQAILNNTFTKRIMGNGDIGYYSTSDGHCFGMALSSILNHTEVDKIAVNNGKTHLYEVSKDMNIESLLSLYQALQQLPRFNNDINNFMSLGIQDQLKLICDLVQQAKSGGSPVLLDYGFKDPYNSSNNWAHAVVAYDIENINETKDINGKQISFDKKIKIYNSNYGNINDDTANLFINTNTNEWFIEDKDDYDVGSHKKGSYLKRATSEMQILNTFNRKTEDYNYIANLRCLTKTNILLTFNNMSYEIYSFLGAAVKGFPDLLYYSDSAGIHNSTDLNIILPDENGTYEISTKSGKAEELKHSVNLNGFYLYVEGTAAKGAIFNPSGSVTLKGNEGDFKLTLAGSNIPDGEFDIYNIYGTADNTGDITLSATDNSIRVEGEKIDGIQIEAKEGDITDTKTIEVNGNVEYGRKSDELMIFFDDIDVNTFSTSLSETKFVYDGQSHIPEIKVTHNDKVLVEGTDYKVTLPEDTVNVGKKEIIVEGINDYSGTFKSEYEIVDGNQVTPTRTDANASSNTNVNTVSKPNATSSGGTATKAVASTGTVTSASKTGDNNLTGLWITLSAVSAGILGAIIVAIKKRRTE